MIKKVVKPSPTKKKLSTEERRSRVLEEVRLTGAWFKNKTRWAEELGCTRDTLRDDLKWAYSTVEPADLNETRFELKGRVKKALHAAEKVLDDPNAGHSDKMKAAATIAKLSQEYTSILEAYGEKKPVAQQIEHSGEVATKLFAIDASAYKVKK